MTHDITRSNVMQEFLHLSQEYLMSNADQSIITVIMQYVHKRKKSNEIMIVQYNGAGQKQEFIIL